MEPREHLPPLFYPGAADRTAWQRAGDRRWGSAVYAGAGAVRRVNLPDFHGHVIGVEIAAADRPGCRGEPLRVFSVHAPIRGSYQKAVNQVLDMIAEHAGGGALVIGGDFNLTVGVRHASESRATSSANLAIQRRLRDDFGLVNCWQEANPDRPLAQTLRWSNDRTIPYHCDGLFVPRSWSSRLRACEVVSSPEWDRLSDHSPVIARFDDVD